MERVEGAEQPLASDATAMRAAADTLRVLPMAVIVVVVVVVGDSEEEAEPARPEGGDSWQWAELKWSRREEESGAVKSQRRQRQHACTRLRREREREEG